MATNIPLTGNFKVTCEYKRKGNWAAGWHTGIDLVSDNTNIYSSCDGTVYKTGWDNSYGNYIVVKNSDGKYHWFCHLSKINVSKGNKVTRTSVIGIMGSTGNSTGRHLHFEIRNTSNKYGDTSNPADYMGIPNKVGNYNSSNYQIGNTSSSTNTKELKTLARDTNLRSAPTTSASKVLYLKNTTLYVLEKSVAKADGYTWDKVQIRVNGKEGYMINQNYK
jgi:hypothetical protein